MDNLFTEIYEQYYKDVYRLIYSYLLNKQDTEDILQKTFTKLYKECYKFHGVDSNVKKWLFKVAINEVNDYFKLFWNKNKTYINMESISNVKNSDNEITLLVASLEKQYRLPIYLYYYEGYNISEIAKIMNKTETCIKTRLKRAKEKLKQEMEGEVYENY